MAQEQPSGTHEVRGDVARLPKFGFLRSFRAIFWSRKSKARQTHEVQDDVAHNLPATSRFPRAFPALFPSHKPKALRPAPPSPARSPLDYFSPRIQGIMERRSEFRTESEAEIEASKDHWSELEPVSDDDGERVAEANVEIFRSLQEKWGRDFFYELDDRWKLSKEPFAEGAQAQLFHAHYILWPDGYRDSELCYTAKVFKQGTSLRDLQRQWPHGMQRQFLQQNSGFLTYTDGPRNNPYTVNLRKSKRDQQACDDRSGLHGGVLLKDGRFAFIMFTYWGDLRKLIDFRMQHNSLNTGPGPPFVHSEAIDIMMQIAKGMRGLHKDNIIHRDLKASNVLVRWPHNYENMYHFDASLVHKLEYHVADYETSVGIVGTGFWRAPEILLGLKNRDGANLSKLFSEKSDVYSFGMTCYEILTGRIPFEGFRSNDYDVVLGGERPHLPGDVEPLMKALLNRCWHQDPAERPTFQEIVDDLETATMLYKLEPSNSTLWSSFCAEIG